MPWRRPRTSAYLVTTMIRTLRVGVLLVFVGLTCSTAGAADEAAKGRRCQATKLAAVGRHDACLANAEARAVTKQTTPSIGRCDAQLQKKWRKAEKSAGGACPTGDLARARLASTRHGAFIASLLDRPQSSGVCTAPGVTFAYSYMITNRATPFATTYSDIVPAAPGSLTFFTAAGAYQGSNPQQSYEEVTQDVFLTRLKADLALAASGGKIHLGLYVHGLANVFTDALSEMGDFGCALATSGSWPGLLIGFSWPSYDFSDSALFYATKSPPPPPLMPQTSGSIRDNILGSRQSFDALVQLLESQVVATSQTPVELSFLTHSEGNYMLMVGLSALSKPASVAKCLMLAADVSAVSLQTGEQGQAIAGTCGQVTVYYSGADETLSGSNYEFFQYHRQDYPTRLGVIGPYYNFPAPKALNANVVGLDCSAVTVFPAVSSIYYVHSSYLYLPALMLDEAQTMLSLPQPKRSPIPGTTQGFTLQQ
jgi:esterase/lipase superfamily enzyme